MFKPEFIEEAQTLSFGSICWLDGHETMKYYEAEFVFSSCLEKGLITKKEFELLKFFYKYADSDVNECDSTSSEAIEAVRLASRLLKNSDFEFEGIPPISELQNSEDLGILFECKELLLRYIFQHEIEPFLEKVSTRKMTNPEAIYAFLTKYPINYIPVDICDEYSFPLLDYTSNSYHDEKHETYEDWRDRVLD